MGARGRRLPSRREVLAWGGSALGALALPRRALAIPGPRRADAASFPTGVSSGDVGTHTVALRARVDGLADGESIGVEVARDRGFAEVVLRRRVPVWAHDGGIARVRLRSRRLRPGEPHWYRFAGATGSSPVGRFRMLRPLDSEEPVRLAWFSCQGWQAGYFTAHAALAAEGDLDLALSVGDYVYELTDDTGPSGRVDPIGPDHDGFAQTLDEYRAKYRLYQSDRNLQDMHAAHPFFAVWDNHELADDSPGHLRGKPIRVPLAGRKANGRRAFWEALPMEPAGDDRAGLYRVVRLGRHADLFLLDTHSYADPPASGGTYLGRRQLAWLARGLTRSRATWKLVASTTVMMGTDLTPGQPINLWQWDGYPEERRALMELLLAHRTMGVVVLSGDLHTQLAGRVTTTGRSDGDTAAIELNPGAITSNGLIEMLGLDPAVAPSLEETGRLVNPHLDFLDLLAKGYAVLEADARELRVVYRSPGSVMVPESPARDRVRFRASPGIRALEVVARSDVASSTARMRGE